jgi:hypothetical protein
LSCQADIANPADCGFAAVSGTFYVNTNEAFLNPGTGGAVQHTGVAIAANGNIIIGWENDGSAGITDFEAVWTLYGPTGNLLTPPTVQTNRDVSGGGECGTTYEGITNTWLAFFRSDNTAIGGYTGWGGFFPKGNRFGDGIGTAAMCWEIGLEIPELLDINLASEPDEFPVVQLLNNDGTPFRPGVINGLTNLGILTFTAEDVSPPGNIRGGDFDYLSDGNIVISGHSEQDADWVLTGQGCCYVPVYRIWTPGGQEVHGYAAASSEPIGGDMYRGVGVTANGFALRWTQNGGGSTMRLFDNAGNPTSADINLATLTGHPEVSQGGNGGGGDVANGNGFHGNGVDAYVYANSGGSPGTPWVTVINADGTLRWSRQVQDDSDPIDTSAVPDLDAAIDPSGRVIVVFSSPGLTNANDSIYNLTQARFFDQAGNPLGPRFVVSERENQATEDANPFTVGPTHEPRVAWRGNHVVFVWLSQSSPTEYTGSDVVAARILAAPITITSVSHSGTTTTINWTGGSPNYSLQRRSPLTGSWSTVQTGITGNSTTYADSATQAYYRVLCPQ